MSEGTEEKIIVESLYLDEIIQKAVDAGRKAEKTEPRNIEKEYFKKTERLLYAYPDLKAKIEQDEEDFKVGVFSSQGRKSKDVVRYSANVSIPPEEQIQLEQEKGRRASLERTKREVLRIDRALELIRWRDKDKTIEDPYFGIIELKYFYGMKEEDICELDYLKCGVATIYRNKGRLVGRLKNILFGADALPRE